MLLFLSNDDLQFGELNCFVEVDGGEGGNYMVYEFWFQLQWFDLFFFNFEKDLVGGGDLFFYFN